MKLIPANIPRCGECGGERERVMVVGTGEFFRTVCRWCSPLPVMVLRCSVLLRDRHEGVGGTDPTPGWENAIRAIEDRGD